MALSSSSSSSSTPEKSEPTTSTTSVQQSCRLVGLKFEPYVSLNVPTSDDMEELGALLSVLSRPRDVILLDGDLGAGKTTFSRGFIRCKMGLMDDKDDDMDFDDDDDDHESSNDEGWDDEKDIIIGGKEEEEEEREGEPSPLSTKNDIFRVTSPTYLLSNTYIYRDGQESSSSTSSLSQSTDNDVEQREYVSNFF